LQYSDRLVEACIKYHWPGNLRELGNFVKRFLVLQDERLAISELAEKTRPPAPPQSFPRTQINWSEGLKSLVRSSKDETELKALKEALSATNWNRKMAAARLNISYKAILNKIKLYHMTPPD
jgi:DNA-binding NtrC family response regulator